MVIIEQVKLFPNYFPNQPIFDPKPFCLDITSMGGIISKLSFRVALLLPNFLVKIAIKQ
jgi:hypothetical protein